MKVLSRNQGLAYLGSSNQARYLSSYLKGLNTKTILVENNYVDKDFLIDYAKFYARSFEAPQRFTKRVHFFSSDFTIDSFKTAIEKYDHSLIQTIRESYLGFTIVKPIGNQHGEPLIGRTVVRTYPEKVEGDFRYFLTHSCLASLHGISLGISSLPYQTQDMAVAACATTALWIVSHPFSALFTIPTYSPVEITEKAVTYPGEQRNFPSSGLTILQMIDFINFLGLDTENINILPKKEEMISEVVKAYIKAQIPVIACLKLEGKAEPGYHAVVVSGYRYDSSGTVKELYVHDDQIGPYSRVKLGNNSTEWQNEWITHYGFKKMAVERLLVPVYPKIRLTFGRIHAAYLKEKDKIISKGLNVELFLTQVNQYKQYLLKHPFKNKVEILIKSLPRFLWVIRDHLNGRPILDHVYDGTAVFPKELFTIIYEPP